MLRGLKKFAAGNSTTNLAAGSGAQGASAIGAAKAADRPVDEVPPEKAAPQQQQEARKSAEPEQRTEASSSSQAIVAREEPSGNGWAYEEVWAYIDSLGLTKTPGEEHIIRFLSDCITSSPLPAPWAMHRDGDGRVFYGNSATGETTWQHPLEEIVRELSGVCRVCCTLSRRMREKSIADLREAWEVQAKQDFALWYSVKDSSTGKDYFCNSQTGLTMWEHPAEVLLPGHFLKLRGADRLVDEEYLQVLAAMGGTENEGMGQTWNSMKRTLDSSISTKASDLKDDAHQAMKEELASTWSSLRAAKEDAAKVKADFEKLKERFEEAKRTAEDQEMKRSKAEAKLEEEQKRLQLALAECAELKKQAEAKEASNAFDNKEDPHKAIKEELASTAVELKTAREDAAKVKSEHEALQSRFEEAKRSAEDVELKRSEAEAKLQEEQRRLERVMAECESLKQGQEEAHKSSNSAQQAQQAIQQELATATKELETAKANAAQVKTELDALKERFEQAQRNAAELEQQCSQTEAKLTSEQQRLQSVTTECDAWKQQAMATKDGSEQGMKVLEETLKAELDAERERVATLQQEIAEKSSNQAAEATAMHELQAELGRQKEAEAALQEKLAALQAELEQEKASSSSNADAHQTVAKEKDAAAAELRAAQEAADKAKQEFDALQSRFEEAQRTAEEIEQRRSEAEDKLQSEQQRLQLVQGELEAQKSSMTEVQRSVEELEAKKSQVEAKLEAEQRRLQGVQGELEAHKESLKEAERSAHDLELKQSQTEAKLTAEQAKLIAEQARTQSAKEECEIWKTQATASKDGSSESVKKLQETLLADLQAERRQVAELQHEIAEKTSKQAADATAAQLLQDELKRRKEAEIELRTTMQALQEELHQEKSKAADAMSKYAAVSKVREAAVQEVGSVESQTRDLREQLEAQLSEERQKAQQLEAKYEALRDAHETAVRVFAENVGKHEDASPSQRTLPVQGDAIQAALREALEKEKAVREGLLRDQERLEQSTKSLQEQMQKVHTVASELEAKVHQSKSQLEAAENSRPAIPPPQPSQIAGEASLADQALQRQIESARQAEKDLEDRAMAAKASLEEERGRVEKLKAEYTLLLMNQQEMVQTSQKTLETKLEEISAQMREMRGVLSQPQQTPHTEDALATKLAQVSAANARLETAVASEAQAISGTPSSKESKAPTLPVPQEVLAKKVPDPLKDRTFISKLNGKELKIREYNGKMWARTNDAVLIGQKTRHLMLESLAARQQTKLYKEMIQEFDASAVGQKAKLSRAKVAVSSLNASLRDQVEEARRELDQLEDKAKRLGRASHS